MVKNKDNAISKHASATTSSEMRVSMYRRRCRPSSSWPAGYNNMLLLILVVLLTLHPTVSNDEHNVVPSNQDNFFATHETPINNDRRLEQQKYYPIWGLDNDKSYCQQINQPADFTTYDSLEECCSTWFPDQSSGLCLSNNNEENTVQKIITDEVTFVDESTGLCNEVAIKSLISSSDSAATIGKPYGFVFSVKNEGNDRVEISSLSVEMDTTNQVNFTLFAIDGMYIQERGNDGTIISTAIGSSVNQQFSVTSNGTQSTLNTNGNESNSTQSQWQEVASGQFQYSKDYVVDEDGAVLLPFSSFSSPGGTNASTIGMEPNSTKSFYLKMTDIVMKVEKLGQGGETVDDLASTISTGNGSGLKMFVGRGVVFPDWIDVSGYTTSEFDAFYYPARLLGKVWTQEACPATAAPTSELTTSKPSMSPTSQPSRTPSRAPSRSPTTQPSASPTTGPSSSPSTSPSVGPSSSPSRSPSSSPTRQPTVAPTTAPPSMTPSLSPTATMEPTYNPSDSPSFSSNPTQIPSAQPSLSPSHQPSSVPSLLPSFLPSESVFPSATPTTRLTYLTITDEFMFNIWHPPGDEAQAQVEKDIIGNVTESFNNRLFTDPESLLYPFARDYDLAITETPGPTVSLVEDPKGVSCETDNKLENRANICNQYSVQITFDYSRKIPPGVMKSWLLEVSDLIRGNLNASYQGAKAVRSNQVIVFNNARNVNAKEKPTFCDAIEDELVESQYLSNYTILFVDCSQFDFAPRKNRGLLRRVQDNDELEVGQLNVTFAVSGEYRFADSLQGEERRVDFGDLVEDSINADPVKVVKNLEERNVMAVKDSTVVGYELDPVDSTPAPTRAPTPAINRVKSVPPPTENSATSTTGLAVIIVCAVIVIIIAGVLFYRGMKRSKNDEEQFYDYEDEYSEDEKKMTDRGDSYATIITPALTDHSAVSRNRATVPKDDISDRYTGKETNIFGDVVGVDNSRQRNPKSNQDRLGSRANQYPTSGVKEGSHDTLWSRKNPNGSNVESLDEFEARILRKSNRPGDRSGGDRSSLDQLDSFEARILKKGNGSDGDRSSRKSNRSDHDKSHEKLDSVEARILRKGSGPMSKSERARESFDERLASKLAESDQSVNSHGVPRKSTSGHRTKSDGSGSTFEERLKRKLDKDGGNAARATNESPTNSFANGNHRETFEDRLSRKMKQGNRNDATTGHSANSDGSGSTLEERVKKKLDKDGGNAARATNESPTNSFANGNHRETFEDRLSRKMKQGQHKTDESKREQHSKTAPEYVTSNGSESSARSALDRWDEKVRKKNGGSKQDRDRSESYESLLQRKKEGTYTRGRSADSQKSVPTDRSLSTERSASIGPERHRSRSNDASRKLDDFDAKIQRKLDEGKTKQSADNYVANNGSKHSDLEEWEAKIRKKKIGSDRTGSKSVANHASSERYNALIQRKTEEGEGTAKQRDRSPASHATRSSEKQGSASSFERRLQEKLKQGNGARGSPESTFETKLNTKLDKEGKRSEGKPDKKMEEMRAKSAAQASDSSQQQGSAAVPLGPAEIEKQRRAEVSAIMRNKSLSREEKKRQMDMVRGKYANNSKHRQPQQDSQRMKDFEARIQAKTRG